MAGLGLSNAVSQFFGAQRAAADDTYRERVRKTQVSQLDDEDARLSDINAARAAGAAVMAQRQSESDQAPQMGLGLASPGARPEPSFPAAGAQPSAPAMNAAAADSAAGTPGYGPSAASMPAATAAPAAVGLGDVQPAGQAKPRGPNPDHILEAYDATANELAKRGRWDDWAQTWQKAAAVRDTLRNQALDKAEGEFRLSGDPTVFAKNAYKYIDDGYSLVKADKAVGADGKTVYNVTRKNNQTGAEETRAMSGEDLMKGAQFARDPNAVRKAEADFAMKKRDALMKTEQAIAEDTGKQPGRIQLENLKGDRAKEIERMKDARMVSEGALNRGVTMRGQHLTDARAKDATAGGADGFSPAAIENAAARYNMDGTLPPMGMGKAGAAGRQAILNRAAEVAMGSGTDQRLAQLDTKSASSALTQLTKSKTMNAAFEKTANSNAELALGLSGQMDRTGVPLLNAGLQAWRSGTGSPEATQFAAANQTFVAEYAKIMSGGMGNGPVSDSARGKAEKLLTTAMTQKQYEGNVKLLQKEMSNRMKGFDDEEAGLRARMKGQPAAAAKPSAAAALHPPEIADLLKKYGG